MRIRGILKDDIRTRAKLVEKPAEQLDLLVHVLFIQGRRVELVWRAGEISGDPALVMYVQRCVDRRRLVPTEPDGALVPVTLEDGDSVAACVRDVVEGNSFGVEEDEEELAPTFL